VLICSELHRLGNNDKNRDNRLRPREEDGAAADAKLFVSRSYSVVPWPWHVAYGKGPYGAKKTRLIEID
jgi:hypothetical protein